jgi:hypothetical protein
MPTTDQYDMLETLMDKHQDHADVIHNAHTGMDNILSKGSHMSPTKGSPLRGQKSRSGGAVKAAVRLSQRGSPAAK